MWALLPMYLFINFKITSYFFNLFKNILVRYSVTLTLLVSYEKTIMNHKTPKESFQYEDENKTKSIWNRNYSLDNINHRITWNVIKQLQKKMSNYHLRPFIFCLF